MAQLQLEIGHHLGNIRGITQVIELVGRPEVIKTELPTGLNPAILYSVIQVTPKGATLVPRQRPKVKLRQTIENLRQALAVP